MSQFTRSSSSIQGRRIVQDAEPPSYNDVPPWTPDAYDQPNAFKAPEPYVPAAQPNRLRFHPLTAIFPMMPKQGIIDMAASIKKQGQAQPIITVVSEETGEELIVIGRARYEACLIDEVEPRVEGLGENFTGDLFQLIIDSNLEAHNWTYAQKARAAAIAVTTHWGGNENVKSWSLALGGKQKLSQPEAAKIFKVSLEALKQAAFIRKHAPYDLDKLIEAGTHWVTLNGAYGIARMRASENLGKAETAQSILDLDAYKRAVRRARELKEGSGHRSKHAKPDRAITKSAIKRMRRDQGAVFVADALQVFGKQGAQDAVDASTPAVRANLKEALARAEPALDDDDFFRPGREAADMFERAPDDRISPGDLVRILGKANRLHEERKAKADADYERT
jgi:hypothetical protein